MPRPKKNAKMILTYTVEVTLTADAEDPASMAEKLEALKAATGGDVKVKKAKTAAK